MSSVLYLSGQKNEHWFLLPCLPVLFNHFFFSSSSFLYSSSFSYLLVTLRDRQNFPVYFGFSFPFIYHFVTNSFFLKKKKKNFTLQIKYVKVPNNYKMNCTETIFLKFIYILKKYEKKVKFKET
jgi:hypothetical protein